MVQAGRPPQGGFAQKEQKSPLFGVLRKIRDAPDSPPALGKFAKSHPRGFRQFRRKLRTAVPRFWGPASNMAGAV